MMAMKQFRFVREIQAKKLPDQFPLWGDLDVGVGDKQPLPGRIQLGIVGELEAACVFPDHLPGRVHDEDPATPGSGSPGGAELPSQINVPPQGAGLRRGGGRAC